MLETLLLWFQTRDLIIFVIVYVLITEIILNIITETIRKK